MIAAVKEAPPAAGPVMAPHSPATGDDSLGLAAVPDFERLVYLGRMVSAVSHELGNRLTSVLGFAEMAAQAPDPEVAPRLLAKMNNYAEDLRMLVEGLTGFSARRLAVKEDCDPEVLVRQVVELAACEAKTSGVRLAFHGKGGLPQVRVVVGEVRLGLFMCLDTMVRDLAGSGVRDAHLLAEVRRAPDGGVQVVFRPSDPLGHGNGLEPISTVLARAERILTTQGVTTKWVMREEGVSELVAEFSREVCHGGC